MDTNSEEPVQKDTIVRLWSNTKPITGVATMICYVDGLLTIDDPVSKYIPTFRNPVVKVLEPTERPASRREEGRGGPMMIVPTVSADRDITIRDCLRNTTGLATSFTLGHHSFIWSLKEDRLGMFTEPIRRENEKES